MTNSRGLGSAVLRVPRPSELRTLIRVHQLQLQLLASSIYGFVVECSSGLCRVESWLRCEETMNQGGKRRYDLLDGAEPPTVTSGHFLQWLASEGDKASDLRFSNSSGLKLRPLLDDDLSEPSAGAAGPGSLSTLADPSSGLSPGQLQPTSVPLDLLVAKLLPSPPSEGPLSPAGQQCGWMTSASNLSTKTMQLEKLDAASLPAPQLQEPVAQQAASRAAGKVPAAQKTETSRLSRLKSKLTKLVPWKQHRALSTSAAHTPAQPEPQHAAPPLPLPG